MKFIYILFLMPFFWALAENADYTKIEALINENARQLEKEDVSSKEPLDKKRALNIAKEIQTGTCPKTIDKKIMSLVIKNLILTEPKVSTAPEAFNCLESAGFKKEDNYTLMVDLLPLWKTDNQVLELFYTNFFKGYKKPKPSVLGLLDNAKLMCGKVAVNYLEENKYPANFNKSMTEEEYKLFIKYIKNYRCDGY